MPMAAEIRVFMTLNELVDYVQPLYEKYSIHCYAERLGDDKKVFTSKIELSDLSRLKGDQGYVNFFFSSSEIDLKASKNLYDDAVYMYAIEGTGGREEGKELELIKLRILAKAPEKNIKSFHTAIQNKLKKDEAFGSGVYSGAKAFYKDIFYLKTDAQKRVLWFDFKRKKEPVTIADNATA